MEQNRKMRQDLKVRTQARNLTSRCCFNNLVYVLVCIIGGREAIFCFRCTEALTETDRDQEFYADSSTFPASCEKANQLASHKDRMKGH